MVPMHPASFEHLLQTAPCLGNQRQQQVFGADILILEPFGLLLCFLKGG